VNTMNDLMIALVASPGGTDAIAGSMAKAPPGESPPSSAAGFLSVLLQTIPTEPSVSLPALFVRAVTGEPGGTATEAPPDGQDRTGDAEAPTDPSSATVSLTALGMAALAVAFPIQAAVCTETTSTASMGGGPTDGPAQNGIAGLEVPGVAPDGGQASTITRFSGLPLPLLTTELSQEQKTEIQAEIPAPETREGSANEGDHPAPLMSNHATREAEILRSRTNTPAEAPAKEGPVSEPTGPAVRAAQNTVGSRTFAPSPTMLPAGDGPANETAADRPQHGVVDGTGGGTGVGRRSGQATVGTRPVTAERPVRDMPDRAVDAPQSGSRETRKAGGRPGDTAGGLRSDSAKPVERALVGELLSTPLSTGTIDEAVPKTEGAGENTPVEDARPAAPALDAGKAQATTPGGTQQGKEPAEPIVTRHVPVGFQGHPQKESADGLLMKDALTSAGRLHGKLTEELSRSVLDQVVKHVALQVRGEMSEMKIRLDPPSLGEMQVTVRVDEGRVQAQIDVSQPAVRVALETGVPQLRQTLADQGIELSRIDVCASGSSMSRESHEGDGHRDRKRDGGRQQGSLEGVEQYRGARMLGYNTIEMVM